LDILPLGLILIAAFLHAFWNFIAKGAAEPRAMLSAALWASLILYAPLFAYRFPSAEIAPGGWYFILATGVLHALYFYALGRAYGAGDLSRVYPLARGSAPILVVGIAAVFLGERVSASGSAGILLVVAGVLISYFPSGGEGSFRQLWAPEARWALATGLVTATYSVVDKAGVTRVPPDVYIYLMFLCTALFLLPAELTRGREALAGLRLGERKGLLRAAAGGVCMMGAYGLVLYAMRLSMVSYVVAAQEVSVVIGAALGVFVLKEGGGRQKLSGAALVVAGLVLLAISK
jgi:uncharacterized membrane protein